MESPGRVIAQRRQALGWAQGDLADAAGLSQQHVSLIERGKVAPTQRTLEKLLAALALEATFTAAPATDLRQQVAASRSSAGWEEEEIPPGFTEALHRADDLYVLASAAAALPAEDMEEQARAWSVWRSRLPAR